MTPPDLNKLITAYELSAKYPKLKMSSIRYWLEYRKDNGLQDSGAIVKISRRTYIDEAKFMDWLQKNKVS